MCGICGYFRFGNPPSSLIGDAPVLLRMRDTLRHRGPDDAGEYAISPSKVVARARPVTIPVRSQVGVHAFVHEEPLSEAEEVPVRANDVPRPEGG